MKVECKVRHRYVLPLALIMVLLSCSLSIFVKQEQKREAYWIPFERNIEAISGKSSSKWSETLQLAQEGTHNSAAGSLFHGLRIRKFTGPRNPPDMFENPAKKKSLSNFSQGESCTKWSVVTTVFEPSIAVKNAAALDEWCTVIVADTETPTNYMEAANFHKKTNVHFLSVDNQQQWGKEDSAVGEFIRAIPYRHIARKNLGYLYAIQHGAQFVFDFDDDNILDVDQATGNIIDPIPNSTTLENVRVPVLGKSVLNHHPLMGADQSWARGFPVEMIQDSATKGFPVAFSKDVPMRKIGVLQYCTKQNPDVDAIHRLVKSLPVDFGDVVTTPLMVPSHAFAPYNTQATVHTKDAMFALLLPFSVPGRVSDVWRGYFAQALFRDLDLSLVFLPPRIHQDRNEHELLADMQAELDLYFKAGKLVEFLSSWDYEATHVSEKMEVLWIELYERGYIEIEDVKVLQIWLRALVSVGYEFPRVVRKRQNNIVLMGQFNYGDTPIKSVVFWAQKWRSVVPNLVVRGPFDSATVTKLRKRGIPVVPSVADRGMHSPISNLMETVADFANRDVDGVMYVHDDAILNISSVFKDFPYGSIVSSVNYDSRNRSLNYEDVRNATETLLRENMIYKVVPGAEVVPAVPGTKLNVKWYHFNQCKQSLQKMFEDPEFAPYKDSDGTFLNPSRGQSDFLYVPTKYSDEFTEVATLVMRYNFYLECGLPTVVQMMRQRTNVTVGRRISLCTSWDKRRRGTEHMIKQCGPNNEMVHPFKLSKGLSTWDAYFDKLMEPA